MEGRSEVEAMAELAQQMWDRFFKGKVVKDLLAHSLDGYKAMVYANNGDGTLTVVRPFDNQRQTMRCPPALAQTAESGDQVLVVQLGDASNSFILCGADLSGLGDGGGGGRYRPVSFDFSTINDDSYYTETVEGPDSEEVSTAYAVTRDQYGRIITVVNQTDGWQTTVEWGENELLPASEVSFDPTGTSLQSTTAQGAISELANGGGGGGGGAAEGIIATVEASATASKSYAVKDYLILSKVLYRVTSPISAGDTIVNGTNVTVAVLGDDVAAQAAQIGTNQANISAIEGKIPSAASTSNQLADKAFVTDSITQGTAIFRGSFATKAALLAVAWQTADPNAPYYVSNNDYAVVLDDETQSDECWRYIYVTGTGWTPQYRINETPMTQAQLDALNSGATAAIISSVADKLDKTGDGKDVTATFTAASARANISTGEKLSVLFGKIAKWFTDLGTAAFAAISASTPNMDGTGAAGSTGEVADAGHVHPSDTSRVPVYGMGKNLLDNAYFGNPVNQRGQTSYSGSVHCIDRWNLTGGSCNIQNGISVLNGGLRQWVPADRIIDGATYTLSLLTEYGLKVGTGTISSSQTGWFFSSDSVNGWVAIGQYNSGRYDFRITGSQRNIAAKLELGTEQTLAHIEGSTWVLNDIPDYKDELANCLKYTFAFNSEGATYGTIGLATAFTATQAECLVSLPAYMQKTNNSSMSYSGSWQLTDGISNGQRIAVTSMALTPSYGWSGNTVVITVTASGLTPGKIYYLRANNDVTARILISADL